MLEKEVLYVRECEAGGRTFWRLEIDGGCSQQIIDEVVEMQRSGLGAFRFMPVG